MGCRGDLGVAVVIWGSPSACVPRGIVELGSEVKVFYEVEGIRNSPVEIDRKSQEDYSLGLQKVGQDRRWYHHR